MKRAARRLLALLLIAVLPMQALAALAGVGCPWRGGSAAGAAHADIHAHAAVPAHDVATDPPAVAGSAVHGSSADAALASPDSPASCHGTDGLTHATGGGAGCAGCSIVAATIPSAPHVDTGALAQAYAPFVPDPPPAARPERLERPQRGRPA